MITSVSKPATVIGTSGVPTTMTRAMPAVSMPATVLPSTTRIAAPAPTIGTATSIGTRTITPSSIVTTQSAPSVIRSAKTITPSSAAAPVTVAQRGMFGSLASAKPAAVTMPAKTLGVSAPVTVTPAAAVVETVAPVAVVEAPVAVVEAPVAVVEAGVVEVVETVTMQAPTLVMEMPVAMEPPLLIYGPLAGRAELARLIAAAGQLPITELIEGLGKPDIEATGESKRNYMSPSGMPLLVHGDLKMSQSAAVETYIANIAPRYSGLSVQQRAIDHMYQGIKEEVLMNCAKAVFITQKTDMEQAKSDVIALLDKWFDIFEEQLPIDGFILGLPFPTPADLAILNITIAFMPFGAAIKMAGGYDFNKWPKVMALCNRTAADPYVAEYMQNAPYTTANPFGL